MEFGFRIWAAGKAGSLYVYIRDLDDDMGFIVHRTADWRRVRTHTSNSAGSIAYFSVKIPLTSSNIAISMLSCLQ